MQVKVFRVIVVFLVLILSVGCHVSTEQNDLGDEMPGQQPDRSQEQPPAPVGSEKEAPSTDSEKEAPPAEHIDSLKQEIEQMSLADKLGQMLIVGFDGTELSPSTRELLSNYRIGGVILYSKNMKTAGQAASLINELKSAYRDSGIAGALLIGTDQEGGRVSRLPTEIAQFPASRTIGDTMDEEQARELGASIGEALQAFGINMNFAPVLDVNTNPANPVIGDRAYGTTVEVVKETGIAVMQGIEQEGVIPVIKHFPGHGDTDVDSHTGLPMVRHDLKRLREIEFAPFAEAIRQGADAVMIAHLLMSELDSERPASMSPVVIQEYLRTELGFKGVVITDDMTMGAISGSMEIGEASVQAVLAGADMVMIGHDPKQQQQVITAMMAAAQDGTLPQEAIDRSVYRILSLKQTYALDDKPVEPVKIDELNTRIEEALKDR